LSAVTSDGFGFCSVVLYVFFYVSNGTFTRDISGWDLHDTVYSRELLISNSGNGYRDLIATIDLSTFRRIPWEKDVPFFLVSFLDPETKEPVSVCPRAVLKKLVGKAEQSGWQCIAGIEYEVCAPEVGVILD
jgi:glutamine synthetase